MKKIPLLLISILILFTAGTINAQTGKWYFGPRLGLQFNTDATITPVQGSAMNTIEGCTSVIDVNNNLLFYADGKRLWNGSTNQEVTGGADYLLGGASSVHAALAVPIPNANCSKFLVFTTPGWGDDFYDNYPNGLGVSLITVNGTSGSYNVTKSTSEKVVPSTNADSAFAEKLASTADNADGYWLVAHKFTKSNYKKSDRLYAYHITSNLAAVKTTSEAVSLLAPVINTFEQLGTSVTTNLDAAGQIKFNKDGTKLALALSASKKVLVFNFNKVTGEITWANTFSLSVPDSFIYGLEFSPNGTVIYVSESYGAAGTSRHIHQIDLATATSITVPESHFTAPSNQGYYGLQLGPNNKIYVAGPGYNKATLSVINNPDQLFSACNFVKDAVALGDAVPSTNTIVGLPSAISLPKSCTSHNTIVNYTSEKKLHIYPNPNSGNFNIRLEAANNAVYELYSAEGLLLKRQLVSGNEEIKENLKPGFYFIKLIQNGIETIEKIIVK